MIRTFEKCLRVFDMKRVDQDGSKTVPLNVRINPKQQIKLEYILNYKGGDQSEAVRYAIEHTYEYLVRQGLIKPPVDVDIENDLLVRVSRSLVKLSTGRTD